MSCGCSRKSRQADEMKEPGIPQIPEADLDIELKDPQPEEKPLEAVAGGSSRIKFAMAQTVAEAIDRFAAAEPKHEVGGLLLGKTRELSGSVLLLVEGHIEAKYTESRQGSVTFTHRAWEYMHAEKDRLFPELKIVGWFHTHPGFGIFLSSQDLFIHRFFFNSPQYLAYVVDPRKHLHGGFRWEDERIVRCDPVIGPIDFLRDFDKLTQEEQELRRRLGRERWKVRGLLGICLLLLLFSVGILAGMHLAKA